MVYFCFRIVNNPCIKHFGTFYDVRSKDEPAILIGIACSNDCFEPVSMIDMLGFNQISMTRCRVSIPIYNGVARYPENILMYAVRRPCKSRK